MAGFSCGHLKQALCGYKHLHSVGSTSAKLPIMLPLLWCIIQAVNSMSDIPPHNHLILQVAYALAFTCFLQSGEIIWDQTSNCSAVLMVVSVERASDHTVITLPTSKTNSF